MRATSVPIRLGAYARNLLRRCTSPWDHVSTEFPEDVSPVGQGRSRRVLCASSVGFNAAVLPVDSVVAMGLKARGAEPHFLLCDHALPSCEVAMIGLLPDVDEFIRYGPRRCLCKGCFAQGYAYYRPLPIRRHYYSDFVSKREVREYLDFAGDLSVEECFGFEEGGIALGEHVRAGVLRFFGAGTLDESLPVQPVAARYLAGALTTLLVGERILEGMQPDCVVAHHGIYVPQGVMGQAARDRDIRLVNWGPSYRNTTAIYSHGDTYHRTMMDEPEALWLGTQWGDGQRQEIEDYLATRRQGKGDWAWISTIEGRDDSREELLAELGLDGTKPIFGLLTNVLYDANLFYRSNAFSSMLEWLFETLDFFIAHPDLQLIVRVHPHEVMSSAVQQRVIPEIDKKYGQVPDNIRLVPPDSDMSTYALMALCRAVMIYGTKTGVELAPTGVPIVAAGEAWIRNKGVTYDVSTPEEYQEVLERLPDLPRSTPDVIERAKRLAYHFFFRRMIPISSLDPDAGWPPRPRIHDVSELLPGKDPGLDVICDGILEGKEFVYEPPRQASPRSAASGEDGSRDA